MTKHIIAVVGLTGSGKTDASQRFVEAGFVRFAYSDAIYEELERLGLERNEKNERTVREGLRKEFGMAMAADRIMPRVEEAVSQGHDVVIESLYSWSEYKKTKERFGDQFRVLAIYAPPDLRYDRLANRPVRPLDRETAHSRDYAEIDPPVEKAGPIAMADWTIQNIGTREEFLKAVDTLIDEINKN